MPKLLDRTGCKYGRLTVVGRDNEKPPASGGRRVYWLCSCSCGNVVSVTGHELSAGDTESCGCLRKELLGDRSRTHGQTLSPTHQSWRGAKERCTNPKQSNFARYGGRGIQMCARWLNSFEAFLEDMGERPRGATLDRIDNDGNYEPGNCRWATAKQQMANRRVSVIWQGSRVTIKEVARRAGVPRTSLNKALRRLGDIEAAVTYVANRMKH